jgi:hypothetical protein
MKLKKISLPVLTFTFVGFVVLSWWILFRDVRALTGFEAVYPFFNGNLIVWRQILLGYSLNVIPTILFAVLGLISFGAYFFLLKEKTSVSKVIKFAVIFQLIAFLAYPLLSTDVFSYMYSNRVHSEYGQNKWLVSPDNFSNDTFAHFADWKSKTNVYGYINHLIYLPADYLGNDDVLTTLLLYKLTTALFAVVTIFVFKSLLSNKSAFDQSYYLKLILWNPLFLFEMIATGHNDIFLVFFILLSLLFWNKKSWIWAGILLAFSMQIKLISIVLFGYFALKLLQRKNVKDFIKYTVSFLIVNVVSFLLMNINPLTFIQRVLYNSQSYWQSLPGLVTKFLPNTEIPFTMIFAVVGILIILLQLKNNWNPVYSSVLAILLYLVIFTGAYWNWYVLWIFVLVPFIKNIKIKNFVIMLTFTSFMAYPLLWFSHRFGFGNYIWDIVTYIWIFGVPIVFLGYNRNTVLDKDKQRN